ncbi:VapC toxin family PIN domain ribonuclease [Rhodoferax koreense]|uniref:Ribonuclease VapC n=1 Tax=Rhodoferax koreensis TaxID=1842727 RepID=A0A1P8K2N8_9BURK|nr:type II toxin-antitoxin system VapC family toxin [Rhodoferax koreense]APW40256.1 VapC toxin family PIN domain ribonuclease [Rhodoferax koreense]
MMLLDTNVLSELMRQQPDRQVLAWLDAQPTETLFVSAVTVAELMYGIERLPEGRRKDSLRETAWTMLEEDFDGRILPFDGAAATRYAWLAAQRERSGRPIGMADAQIAAICLGTHADLATRNTKDFAGLGLVLTNPWQTASQD